MMQEIRVLNLKIVFHLFAVSIIFYLFTGGPLVRYDTNKRKFVVFFNLI